MPRGRKKKVEDSAILDETMCENLEANAEMEEMKETENKKERKAYPTIDERLSIADKNIERLTKLNESRLTLIQKTEKTLNERKSALEKSQNALDKEISKREHFIELKNRSTETKQKRSPKSEEKAQISKLLEALKGSGKTVDELMEIINKQ